MHKRIICRKTITNLPSTIDGSSTSFTIPVPRISQNDHRKCERSNYIPHRTPTYDSRDAWIRAYDEPLNSMYRSIGLMIEKKYPDIRIDWRDPKYHKAFHKLIYHCSSKYIAPYIQEREDDSVIASKELYGEDKGWEKQKGS
jgi:hypothetical protein